MYYNGAGGAGEGGQLSWTAMYYMLLIKNYYHNTSMKL